MTLTWPMVVLEGRRLLGDLGALAVSVGGWWRLVALAGIVATAVGDDSPTRKIRVIGWYIGLGWAVPGLWRLVDMVQVNAPPFRVTVPPLTWSNPALQAVVVGIAAMVAVRLAEKVFARTIMQEGVGRRKRPAEFTGKRRKTPRFIGGTGF